MIEHFNTDQKTAHDEEMSEIKQRLRFSGLLRGGRETGPLHTHTTGWISLTEGPFSLLDRRKEKRMGFDVRGVAVC